MTPALMSALLEADVTLEELNEILRELGDPPTTVEELREAGVILSDSEPCRFMEGREAA